MLATTRTPQAMEAVKMPAMDHEQPYCVDGVWIAPVSSDFLCASCRNRIPHWRGGATCSHNPDMLTVARSCRGYESWLSPVDEAIHTAFRMACIDAFGRIPLP